MTLKPPPTLPCAPVLIQRIHRGTCNTIAVLAMPPPRPQRYLFVPAVAPAVQSASQLGLLVCSIYPVLFLRIHLFPPGWLQRSIWIHDLASLWQSVLGDASAIGVHKHDNQVHAEDGELHKPPGVPCDLLVVGGVSNPINEGRPLIRFQTKLLGRSTDRLVPMLVPVHSQSRSVGVIPCFPGRRSCEGSQTAVHVRQDSNPCVYLSPLLVRPLEHRSDTEVVVYTGADNGQLVLANLLDPHLISAN
mmetsp:Transcript_40280/g.62878  ORF Transcript_40280/g.62878 Transcript_40280/m.62878 type:complete len:246 (-) Transcript_40280:653-1390(-)